VPDAKTGLQEKKIAGVSVWVLPSPSGLNAHYQKGELVNLFRQLYLAVNAGR
jgi:TDG/mug DNA glycosylase family protein